jgi:DNA-binding MarR family transcriptional regulator
VVVSQQAPSVRSVGFLLSAVGYTISRRFHAALAPFELHPREFAVLRGVGLAEGRSQQAVAAQLQIPPSRMVAIVDELEARGLLERRLRPGDRRVRTLHLTPAGRALAERAFQLAAAQEHVVASALEDGERDQLLDMLGRVAAALGLPAGAHPALREEPPA